MPELPEVETVKLSLAESITGLVIKRVEVLQAKLRFPIPCDFADKLSGQKVHGLSRRGKYLICKLDDGYLICHLGMSGSVCVHEHDYQRVKHDHVLIYFHDDKMLRYHDPRRFGMLDFCQNPVTHRLLQHLGPEPLGTDFSGEYLYQSTRDRRSPIKAHIMNSRVVVGVGNIYAAESLFHAGIRPTKPAQTLTKRDCHKLAASVIMVLTRAIEAGGSSIRDFVSSEGALGYFQQELYVYGRDGQICRTCQSMLKIIRLGNRSSVYCPSCQR